MCSNPRGVKSRLATARATLGPESPHPASQLPSIEHHQAAPLGDTASRGLSELGAISGAASLQTLSGPGLLMERARLTGAQFGNSRSAGGSCRLLATQDGTIAVTMARDEDWSLVPAWLSLNEGPWEQPADTCWAGLAAEAATRDTRTLVERARLLGLAVAAAGRQPPPPSHFAVTTRIEGVHREYTSRPARPLVIDLSALWAGPLCGHLLHLCGADVIKVESTTRPDGARFGNATFYGLLNQGKRSVSLDLTQRDGHRTLRQLIARAHIVIESSRPRALRQMGINATEVLAGTPDLTWISITGYGRQEPQANWISFGDDAGVAAGLSDVMKAATGRYEFAGDAIADPLTGIHAALSAWDSWRRGGSRLISLAMTDVAAWCLHQERLRYGSKRVTDAFAAWWAHTHAAHANTKHSHRPITAHVPALGEDTSNVLRQLAIRC